MENLPINDPSTILLHIKNHHAPSYFSSQFCNAFHSFICMSQSTWNMPYGDNTYFLDLALIGVWAVPLRTLVATHPGEAVFKKIFFKPACVQEPAAPTRNGRRKRKRLEAGLGDHLGGPRVKHYTVGGGAGDGEGAHVGYFPKPTFTVSQFEVWMGGGGGRGTTRRAHFLGVTPLPQQAGTQRTRDFFFYRPKGRHCQSKESKSLLPSSASQPPAPWDSNFKKLAPAKSLLRECGIEGPRFPRQRPTGRGWGEREREKRERRRLVPARPHPPPRALPQFRECEGGWGLSRGPLAPE